MNMLFAARINVLLPVPAGPLMKIGDLSSEKMADRHSRYSFVINERERSLFASSSRTKHLSDNSSRSPTAVASLSLNVLIEESFCDNDWRHAAISFSPRLISERRAAASCVCAFNASLFATMSADASLMRLFEFSSLRRSASTVDVRDSPNISLEV